jgi:hypothetical protein
MDNIQELIRQKLNNFYHSLHSDNKDARNTPSLINDHVINSRYCQISKRKIRSDIYCNASFDL